MNGIIYQFGQTALPPHAARWNDPAQGRDRTLRTLGGVYDADRGDAGELELPRTVTVNALALADSRAGLGVTLDALRGLTNRRDRLWLDPHDPAQTNRWCWARLVSATGEGAYDNRIWQPVTLTFRCLTPWQGRSYGGAWNLDSGYRFDSGLFFDGAGATQLLGPTTTLDAPNAGNRECVTAGLVVTAGDAPITSVRVVGAYTDWTWRGTLAPTKQLIIDAGSQTVLNAGAGAYLGFALGANHAVAPWLYLEPGPNSLSITVDAPGDSLVATAQLTYADTWV